MSEPTSVRIFTWACACSVWSDSDCEAKVCDCCDDQCAHYYSRETAQAFKTKHWDGRSVCKQCDEPPIIREFMEARHA